LWGVINGSRVFGRYFVGQGAGHLVNTGSAAGLFPAVGMSSYSTSKYAIVGFTQQLRWELAADGVGVTLLCPGTVKTDIARAPGAGLKDSDATSLTARAPDAAGLARKARRAIERNRPIVRYGPDSYLFSLLRLLPLWVLDPLGRFMAKTARAFLRGELALKK
jgi:short-subunit dehydrogenase